jgi:UDP-2,3-diacylglucosamine pyrophosphatase LpxH
MKLAIIADLHLGSKDIGDGRWKQRALQEVVIPALRAHQVEHVIFAGDTLDFQGSSSSSANKPEQLQHAVDQFAGTSAKTSLLMGNHDDMESCQFFRIMGGPRIVRDAWVDLDDKAGAYLMAPRQDTLQARSVIEQVDVSAFNSRILVLHEDLNVFHDEVFLAAARKKFQLVVNGHNHVFRPIREGVHLLPACLPWKARLGSQCDLTLSRDLDGKLTLDNSDPIPWGFVVVGDDLQPQFVAIDCRVKVVICKIQANEAELEPGLRESLDSLLSNDRHKEMAVRAYVAPRLDSKLEALLMACYGNQFLDLSFSPLQGAGAIARKVRERLPTEEAALEYVRTQHGDWARQMVEQLTPFFQLRTPRNRKEDILKTIKQIAPRGLDG